MLWWRGAAPLLCQARFRGEAAHSRGKGEEAGRGKCGRGGGRAGRRSTRWTGASPDSAAHSRDRGGDGWRRVQRKVRGRRVEGRGAGAPDGGGARRGSGPGLVATRARERVGEN